MDKSPIGIFDSGLGGVSTLRQALHMLPKEDFLYYGDNLNAPYGSRTAEEILSLSNNAIRYFMMQGVKAVLLACNTSTAVALPALQQEFSIPIVGIQPAVAAAAETPGDGIILMTATRATATHPRYLALHTSLPDPDRVKNIPCSAEFVRRVEESRFGPDDYADILAETLAPYEGARVDAVVLGCTHYLFFQSQLAAYCAEHFKGTPCFFDGGQAAAEAMRQVLLEQELDNTQGIGSVSFHTSGEPDIYRMRFEALLNQPMQIEGIDL